MAKIKLTKNELKKQRDSLKQFLHYLPTLQLKKQQLQMRILQARKTVEEKRAQLNQMEAGMKGWIGLLGEIDLDLGRWIIPARVETGSLNIAGTSVPVFKSVQFADIDYDFYTTPLWVDQALLKLRGFVETVVEIKVVQKQVAILEQELRITTQRVNLFEKVKIPECQDNIRVIRIYLGDQQANAVGISKVAKGKIEKMEFEEAAA